MLGYGAKQKTYLDDVFNTYVYTGNNGSQTVNTGLDMSGEGGMVWVKNRSNSNTQHSLFDTLRGVNNVLHAESSSAQASYNYNQTFTSTGFTFNNNFGDTNGNTNKYTSWNFRRAPGFFEIITWTGNNQNNHQISHSLGCAPGFMIIKRVSASEDWTCLHRDMPINSWIDFNQTAAGGAGYSGLWNDVRPTATHINVGANARVNGNGDTYVGYLFAGGESTAATARSVDFDGSNDYLYTAASSDLAFGTGDFTIDFWLRMDTQSEQGIFQLSSESQGWKSTSAGTIGLVAAGHQTPGFWEWYMGPGSNAMGSRIDAGVWYHIAIVRASNVATIYVDGVSQLSQSDTTNYSINTLAIGRCKSFYTNGQISNFRVVKGTAVYTSSFRPPTEPLTNISGTSLLCLNNSSTTGKTVGPTITAVSSPTASIDSPFDDPAGFVFGEDGKQNLVKTGSYLGNDSSDGPKIDLGWEPGFLIVRRFSGGTGDWKIFDNMRGLSGNGLTDAFLESNTTDAEQSNLNCVDISPTGFELKSSDTNWNALNDKYIYIAIRRTDGYVGKPPDAGTGVFFQNTLNASGHPSIRSSNFAGDMGMIKTTAIDNSWNLGTRLTQGQGLVTDTNAAEVANSNWQFDYMNGANEYNNASVAFISYLWKRHAGFDVVTTYGGSGKYVPHSLGRVPEMMILKARNNAQDWRVFHKGVNGGVNPEQYGMVLNSGAGQNQNIGHWHNTAPTATHFRTGTWDSGGANTSYRYLICLFASITGVSKCGYYDGSSSAQTITTGFQPRFVIIKASSAAYPWVVLDTTRGWGSGNDQWLQLNDSSEQLAFDQGAPTSTGFTVPVGSGQSTYVNENNQKYIYYAHA